MRVPASQVEPQEQLCEQQEGGCASWEGTSKGVWFKYLIWQQPHSVHRDTLALGAAPYSGRSLTLFPHAATLGQPLQIQLLEKSGRSLAKWEWGLWEAADPGGAYGEVPGNC